MQYIIHSSILSSEDKMTETNKEIVTNLNISAKRDYDHILLSAHVFLTAMLTPADSHYGEQMLITESATEFFHFITS